MLVDRTVLWNGGLAMGWILIAVGIIGILFARRITRRVILLRFVAVWILLAGIGALVEPEPAKAS